MRCIRCWSGFECPFKGETVQVELLVTPVLRAGGLGGKYNIGRRSRMVHLLVLRSESWALVRKAVADASDPREWMFNSDTGNEVEDVHRIDAFSPGSRAS